MLADCDWNRCVLRGAQEHVAKYVVWLGLPGTHCHSMQLLQELLTHPSISPDPVWAELAGCVAVCSVAAGGSPRQTLLSGLRLCWLAARMLTQSWPTCHKQYGLQQRPANSDMLHVMPLAALELCLHWACLCVGFKFSGSVAGSRSLVFWTC